MAKTYRLIDGYNLMHAAGMARERYGPGDLERFRNRFITWLASHLATSELATATLVFDAQSAGHRNDHQEMFQGMKVIYAASNKDADTLIEELVAEHSAPRQIQVISSDHRLHKAIRKRKGIAIDSEDFVPWLEKREIHQDGVMRHSESTGSAGAVPEEEVDMWLAEFGDIPEADHLKKTRKPQGKQENWIREIEDEFGI
ncbi:YacP-like NYN domain protein [Polystyrenella longa]|uniref:YacP-like NYN domain protein n=1 Tax=Polystyrenella longa TaxID=2528007 RepID=A0A518CQ64_9PLAN|nr:NYN domain-containing protein [Polystyrenella longa]QDU81367.1 YacP-like NYN domain protein [Polystyrenella longa]